MLPFAFSTFNILPLLQPVGDVEMFWFSIQNLTWSITSEGFEGHCHEYLEQAIEFESLLADYVLSTGRNNTVVTARLFRRAQISVPLGKLQFLIKSNCIKTVTLLRYLGHVAKCSHDEALYQNVLRAIMHLASSKNHSSADAHYNIGVIYFDLNEYKLAIEFLNRSLTSNPRIQSLNAIKTMVLAYQRSGQQQLAVETVSRLLPSLLEQAMLQVNTINQSFFRFNSTDISPESFDEVIQTATEMLSRLADSYVTAIDLAITVNDTASSLALLKGASALHSIDFPLNPTVDYFLDLCHDMHSNDILTPMIWRTVCLEIAGNTTRHFLVTMQFLLYRARVQCDMLKAYMKLNSEVRIDDAQNQLSGLVTEQFSNLEKMEDDIKRMHACGLKETNSLECQKSRSQVRMLWQLQYELVDGMAVFFSSLGLLEQAKECTELLKSSVEKKWKEMVKHKLNLAMIELSLGNYWNAVYILRNCSLTIDEQMMETAYKATQPSSTWQSHGLCFPDGHFFVLVYQFYHVFNASTQVLAAVVSGALDLISHAGIGITVTHLLFVAIVAILWSLVFTILLMLGSALYCLKCICSCSLDRHKCWDKFRLFLFDLIIVMCASSHIVVFYSYVLHFHTAVLLTYLNYNM